MRLGEEVGRITVIKGETKRNKIEIAMANDKPVAGIMSWWLCNNCTLPIFYLTRPSPRSYLGYHITSLQPFLPCPW